MVLTLPSSPFCCCCFARAKGLDALQGGEVVAAPEANALACKLHANAAAALLKELEVEGAIEHCRLAVAIDARNVKALFRWGECLKYLQDYEGALDKLSHALLVDESNEAVRESMDQCEDLLEWADPLEANGGSGDGHGGHGGAGPGGEEGRELPLEVAQAAEARCQYIREQLTSDRADPAGNDDVFERSGKDSGEGESTLELVEHLMLNHSPSNFGMIQTRDAFRSAEDLRRAMAFVRQQHFTAAAK